MAVNDVEILQEQSRILKNIEKLFLKLDEKIDYRRCSVVKYIYAVNAKFLFFTVNSLGTELLFTFSFCESLCSYVIETLIT